MGSPAEMGSLWWVSSQARREDELGASEGQWREKGVAGPQGALGVTHEAGLMVPDALKGPHA